MLGAILVFALVGARARQPIRTFRKIAAGALLVSFLPDLALLFGGGMPPASISNVLALMLMHLVAFAISVGFLTTLTRQR